MSKYSFNCIIKSWLPHLGSHNDSIAKIKALDYIPMM